MKLQFTNKYYPRFDQFSRILKLLESQQDGKKVSTHEIMMELGIPQRQVGSFISFMVGCELLTARKMTLTPLGKTVMQCDLFFERTETLWVIHYLVSSNPEFIIWHRIIHTVIPSRDQYLLHELRDFFFSDLQNLFSEYTFSMKIPAEIRSVFYAYTKSALSQLRLISAEEDDRFIKTSPANVPSLAFLYCLLRFAEKCFPGSTALNIEDICYSENSPGRVFFLNEEQVRTLLEEIHHSALIRLERQANLDQVRFLDAITPDFVLQKIYGGQDGN